MCLECTGVCCGPKDLPTTYIIYHVSMLLSIYNSGSKSTKSVHQFGIKQQHMLQNKEKYTDLTPFISFIYFMHVVKNRPGMSFILSDNAHTHETKLKQEIVWIALIQMQRLT